MRRRELYETLRRRMGRSRAAGPAVTLALVVITEAVAGTRYAIPSLGPLLVAVVFSAFVGGLVPGLVSALLMIGYAAHFLDAPGGGLFDYSGGAFARLLVVTASAATTALLVGYLRSRMDRATAANVEAAEEMLRREKAAHATARENAERLAASNRALAEANQSLEAFSYVVAHDLKDPLRATDAYLDALDEDHGDALPDDARRLLGRAQESNRRLNALVRGVLEFSRASTRGQEPPEPLCIRDLLASNACSTRFARQLSERGASLHVDDDIPDVEASPEGAAQLLGNLILNAVRHNPKDDPVVRVSTPKRGRDDEFVEIVVEDNGPGFPAHMRELYSFGRAGEAHPATFRHGGFGLAIARRTVEQHGGQLWVTDSEKLRGAAVRFTLPACGRDETSRRRSPPSGSRAAGNPRGSV